MYVESKDSELKVYLTGRISDRISDRSTIRGKWGNLIYIYVESKNPELRVCLIWRNEW